MLFAQQSLGGCSHMGVNDFTLYDVVTRNAICFTDKQAWFEADDHRTLSYGQYKAMVDRLAYGLRGAGISKGDRIGALGKNSLEFFLLYGSAAALGAIVLPINWRLSSAEIAYNVQDCEPTLLFVDSDYQRLVDEIKNSLPSVERYFNLAPTGGGFLDFETLLDNPGDFDAQDVSSDDGFVIIHTAAVTGKPRGALLSHGNLLCTHMHFGHQLAITPEAVHLSLLPLFHIGGLVMATAAFHAGALTVNMSKFNAEQAVNLIEDKRVSHLFEFAPILASILDQQETVNKDITSLSAVLGLDTPKTIERYQEVTGGTFHPLYAQAETSCLATLGAYNERPGSAGRPALLARVRLVDDDGHTVPPGQVGEISVTGPMVFKGYWNLPEDTNYTFRDGWHHTGDLGRFDEDGFLWYEGRKAEKELIKPGGENVYPAEVESVIMEHPAVEGVVVFGVPHAKWREGIKAVCRLKDGRKLLGQDLIDFVGERIARYKKPHVVEFVRQLPLSADGSLDRAKTKEMYGHDTVSHSNKH
jgi:acyl-CoA synthetase (AMP-forming)/AMP-acid ligase II